MRRFRVTKDRRAADIECAEGSQAEVAGKVHKYVNAMTATFRSLGEPVELARTVRLDDGPVLSDALAELERRRWVRPLGRGQAGFAGGAFALRRFVDDAVREVARTRFGSEEEEYPVLLDPSVLARCGYFSSFPHSVCLVSHLREDFDAIEAFRAANTESDSLRVPDLAAMTMLRCGAEARVCLPVYRALEGTTLPEGGFTVTTWERPFATSRTTSEASTVVGFLHARDCLRWLRGFRP